MLYAQPQVDGNIDNRESRAGCIIELTNNHRFPVYVYRKITRTSINVWRTLFFVRIILHDGIKIWHAIRDHVAVNTASSNSISICNAGMCDIYTCVSLASDPVRACAIDTFM